MFIFLLLSAADLPVGGFSRAAETARIAELTNPEVAAEIQQSDQGRQVVSVASTALSQNLRDVAVSLGIPVPAVVAAPAATAAAPSVDMRQELLERRQEEHAIQYVLTELNQDVQRFRQSLEAGRGGAPESAGGPLSGAGPHAS